MVVVVMVVVAWPGKICANWTKGETRLCVHRWMSAAGFNVKKNNPLTTILRKFMIIAFRALNDCILNNPSSDSTTNSKYRIVCVRNTCKWRVCGYFSYQCKKLQFLFHYPILSISLCTKNTSNTPQSDISFVLEIVLYAILSLCVKFEQNRLRSTDLRLKYEKNR